MGKPTRNEQLAEYYLRAAGVAAVWIDPNGHVGAQDVVSIDIEPGRIVYCCERGCHFILAYRLYEWKKAVQVDALTIATKLEELAERGGVGLTPHATAVDRAMAAVDTVNQAMDKMAAAGELRDLNTAFKAARKLNPSAKYAGYLEARKTVMLEALASQLIEPDAYPSRLSPDNATGKAKHIAGNDQDELVWNSPIGLDTSSVLGIPDVAGFMNVFAGEADVGCGCLPGVPLGNAGAAAKCLALLSDLAPARHRVRQRAGADAGFDNPDEIRMRATRRLDQLRVAQKETVGLSTGTRGQLLAE